MEANHGMFASSDSEASDSPRATSGKNCDSRVKAGLAAMAGFGVLLSAAVLQIGPAGGQAMEGDVMAPAREMTMAKQVGAEIYDNIRLSVLPGNCVRAKGPLESYGGYLPADPAIPRLNVFLATEEHVVCMDGIDGDPSSVHFLADVEEDPAEHGEFGFGPGITIGLRPDIATNALWRMSANIESIGLDVASHRSFRTLAIRTLKDDKVVTDLPLVVVHPRKHEWPVDVHFTFEGAGKCTPSTAPGSPMFVCRANVELTGKTASLIAVCPSCAASGGTSPWTLTVHEGVAGEAPDVVESGEPWIGWQTPVIQSQTMNKWTLTVQQGASAAGSATESMASARRLDQAEDEFAAARHLEAMSSIQVLLVVGDIPLAEDGIYTGHALVQCSCIAFSIAFMATAVLVVGGHLLMLYSLPGPVVAALPALTSLLAAVHFVILFTSHHEAFQLRDATASLRWILPTDPDTVLHRCSIFMLIIFVLRIVAMITYRMKNGTGSMEFAPHHLLVGAWELRALPLVALPMSAAASALAMKMYFGSELQELHLKETNSAMAYFYAAVPVCLLLIAAWVLQTVQAYFSEERVAAMEITLDGHIAFVDRRCDQLRAMPCSASAWTQGQFQSPNWMFAPLVGAIKAVNHDGSQRYGTLGAWATVWTDGPWSGDSVNSEAEAFAMSKKITRTSSLGVDAGIQYAASLSPVMNANPINTICAQAYKTDSDKCFAGVMGLPWVDTVVPAAALRWMNAGVITTSYQQGARRDADTSGELMLCVRTAQMSGVLTGGRLGACFEWCDRVPLRWSVDLIIKVVLGGYVGSMRYSSMFDTTKHVAMHWGIIAMAALCAVLAIFMSPYRSVWDNVSLSASALAVSVAAASASAGESAPMLALAVVVLLLVPVVRLLLVSGGIAVFAWRFNRESPSHALVKRVADHWGSTSDRQRPTPTKATIVPVFGDARGKLGKVELPACIGTQASYYQISTPVPSAGPRPMPPPDGKVRLPMPVDLLFTVPGSRNYKKKMPPPIGAIMTQETARLLYQQEELNEGKAWEEVVEEVVESSHTGQTGKDITKEVIKRIKQDRRCKDSDAISIVDVGKF